MYVLYTLHLKVLAGTGVGSVAGAGIGVGSVTAVVDVSSISFPIVVVILKQILSHFHKKKNKLSTACPKKNWMIFFKTFFEF